MKKLKSLEITPEKIYLSRRKFLAGVGAIAAGLIISSGCERVNKVLEEDSPPPKSPLTGASKDELGNRLTSFKNITTYNNFYEFTTEIEVAGVARDFKTRPWTVRVSGQVRKEKTFAIEDILARFKTEERIYRMRCVEGWSMVIPWLGFPLAKLLSEVEPTSKAKYVKFIALRDPKRMPGQKNLSFAWPYVEGLRLDEALNDLTILSTGLYGKHLRPQNGAPLRLVIPWKYGFKSIKSIVEIELVEKKPVSFWMKATPNEYGFFANVNPDVSHPRWSQTTERRIGEFERRPTLLFNGYEEKVGQMYKNLDLRLNF